MKSGGFGEKYTIKIVLFKDLRVCKPGTQLGNIQSVPKKKEKLRVLIVKHTFL